jgi:hypothetical protein
MANSFRKAARTQRKIRVAVDGISGSGKTFSMLRLAFALKSAGLAKSVAVIDTENGGSEAYAGESPDGVPWEFDVLCLQQHSPTDYVAAMKSAFDAGYDCVVIDSLSHAWAGAGGALEIVDKKGGGFNAWKDVTPLHRRLIESIVNAPAHMLCTMRSKADYIVERNEQGKSVPRKVGMAPVQREGMEYEFDLYGSIEADTHMLKITKSRCSSMQGVTGAKPGGAFWQPLVDWLLGAAPHDPHADGRAAIQAAKSLDELRAAWEQLSVASREVLQAEKDKRKAELTPVSPKMTPPPKKQPKQLTSDSVAELITECATLGDRTWSAVFVDMVRELKFDGAGSLDDLTPEQLAVAFGWVKSLVAELKAERSHQPELAGMGADAQGLPD